MRVCLEPYAYAKKTACSYGASDDRDGRFHQTPSSMPIFRTLFSSPTTTMSSSLKAIPNHSCYTKRQTVLHRNLKRAWPDMEQCMLRTEKVGFLGISTWKIPGRFKLAPFDTSDRRAWLRADTKCVLCLWPASLGLRFLRYVLVFAIVAPLREWTGIDILLLVQQIVCFLQTILGTGGLVCLAVCSTFVGPFFLVFVARRNILVRGTWREIRYWCRFL